MVSLIAFGGHNCAENGLVKFGALLDTLCPKLSRCNGRIYIFHDMQLLTFARIKMQTLRQNELHCFLAIGKTRSS